MPHSADALGFFLPWFSKGRNSCDISNLFFFQNKIVVPISYKLYRLSIMLLWNILSRKTGCWRICCFWLITKKLFLLPTWVQVLLGFWPLLSFMTWRLCPFFCDNRIFYLPPTQTSSIFAVCWDFFIFLIMVTVAFCWNLNLWPHSSQLTSLTSWPHPWMLLHDYVC